mmetsp:Transcript_30034/g.36624  ORF Transcript_30034/g.36624 Transcript_30034/m.36624 type:complete len:445 (+) Transcript_30034:152-1486(+)|eukprot:CAMPEP_0172496158 /NCGR_PEP_ID=MMETSP1066-20121228/82453_1 /TAXON_ID=671091 /ORGANISM="Coscinodiscus wailesii, Strain CCMP2513" /LENGTH=444 /DNA_ID=CAMNT_0013268297 /DNA_START=121 /DNA_END=1455 /DNA_ORIENTATION=+
MSDPHLPQACRKAVETLLNNHFDADSRECIQTLIKLLDNVLTKPSDAQVRSIRLGNPAFHKRVGRKTGGIDFLIGCGFVRSDAALLTSSSQSTLQLLPENESPDRILAARRLLHSRALEVGIAAKDLPPIPPPPPRPIVSTGGTIGNNFDVYRTRSYNTSAAAHGANPASITPDGSQYLSATEKELEILSRKRDEMEKRTGLMDRADRGLFALRPGETPPVVSPEVTTTTTGGGTDGALLASRFKKQEEERQKRENGGFTTKAMRDLEKIKKQKVYSHTLLKINFPCGHVLTGKFLPREKLITVKGVIRECLVHSDGRWDFDLYVVPPRRVLDGKKTLAEEDLVPAAKVFVSWKEPGGPPPGSRFLNGVLFRNNGGDGANQLFPDGQNVAEDKGDKKKKEAGGAKRNEEELINRMMGKGGGGLKSTGKKKSGRKLGGMPKWFKK